MNTLENCVVVVVVISRFLLIIPFKLNSIFNFHFHFSRKLLPSKSSRKRLNKNGHDGKLTAKKKEARS